MNWLVLNQRKQEVILLDIKQRRNTFYNVLFAHKYLLRGRLGVYLLQSSISILGNITSTFMLTYLPALAIRLLSGTSFKITNIVLQLCGFTTALCLITVAYKRAESISNAQINAERMRKIEDYYQTIATVPYETIDCSSYKNLFNAGLESYYDGYHTGFHNAVIDTRNLVLNLAGLLFYSIFIAQISSVMVGFFIGLSMLLVFFHHRFDQWVQTHQASWMKTDTKIKYICRETTALKNAKAIRLYEMQDWFLEKMHILFIERGSWDRKEQNQLLIVQITSRILTAIKYFVAYFAVLQEVRNGMPVSEFVFSVGLVLGVNKWVAGIFDSITFLQLNNSHIENTRKVLDLGAECKEKPRFEKFYDSASTQRVEIELRDVSFAFPETNHQILNHLNLTVHAGEKIAIVGKNGAGKSTLVNLICGLYTPIQGSILVNGQKREAGAKGDFSLFSVIFQEFHLLSRHLLKKISVSSKYPSKY